MSAATKAEAAETRIHEADETVDVRECTNGDCASHREGGPDA